MSTVLDQENRLLSISTPLGDDVLILQSFAASEAVSTLFNYECEMLSAEEGIAPADIVGQRVTIKLRLEEGEERYFDGFVNQFSGGAMHSRELRRYRAEVVPWLWFLTRSSDCRIFQEMTVPDIIEAVFGDFGFSDYELDLQGNHPEREYCVQYRESAFNFLSRLMEEEGVFYWFRHEDGRHTLVIADHKGAYVDCPQNEIEYHPGSLTAAHISQWEHRYEYRSGKRAQTDYNFKTPSTDLAVDTNTLIDLPEIANYELYDYPGEYGVKGDGEDLVKVRMEEEEVAHDIVRCISGCRTLHTLGKFTVTRHECPSEESKAYMITEVQHSATDNTHLVGAGETFYENSFSCIPEDIVFRPERITPRPQIRGPQTAVVTGPAGEEIYPDEYGRVKVQFHWDRYGTRDENSSCWMRVSQVHAGRGFGGIDLPRIGEEVIVDHLEGDPDQPIITGRVYNAENMPPNGLPNGKMISGMMTNTTPGGGGDNTIMLDDTAGNEQIRIHGQYNMDTTVDNDQSNTISNNRTSSVGVDDTETIGSNQSVTVGNNQTINVGVNQDTTVGANQTLKVGSSQSINVGSTCTETIAIAKALSIGAGYQVSVGAGMNESVGGAKAEEIGGAKIVGVGGVSSENVGVSKSVNAGSNISENAGGNFSAKAGGNLSASAGGKFSGSSGGAMSLDAGGDLTAKTDAKGLVDAASTLVLKCGGASITLESGGKITIKGTDIAIKGSKVDVKGSGGVKIKGSKIGEN